MMKALEKAFPGNSLRLAIALVLAVFALGFYAKWQSNQFQIKELKAETKDNRATIAQQKDVIETAGKVAVVQEQAQVATQEAIKATEQKHQAGQSQLQQDRSRVEQKYEALAQTPANLEAKQKELSETNLQAMHRAFCEVRPFHPNCAFGKPKE